MRYGHWKEAAAGFALRAVEDRGKKGSDLKRQAGSLHVMECPVRAREDERCGFAHSRRDAQRRPFALTLCFCLCVCVCASLVSMQRPTDNGSDEVGAVPVPSRGCSCPMRLSRCAVRVVPACGVARQGAGQQQWERHLSEESSGACLLVCWCSRSQPRPRFRTDLCVCVCVCVC
jgi:hypothetical protein